MALAEERTAPEIFKEKERLLLRRGLPLPPPPPPQLQPQRTAPSSPSRSAAPAPSSSAANHQPHRSSAADSSSSNSSSTLQPTGGATRERVKHLRIPAMEYYRDLQPRDVDPGSRAWLFLSPYYQRVPATLSPRPSLGGSSAAPSAGGPSSRLLPLCTPYLSGKLQQNSVEEGQYHNVYYNTTYRLPDTLSYRRRAGRLHHQHPEPSLPQPLAPLQTASPSAASSVTQAPKRSPSAHDAWAREQRHLSWHLMEPYFPDFGHRCMSDEDLVKDLADRLQALLEQQQRKGAPEDLRASPPALTAPLEMADLSQLFGLEDSLAPPVTALQEAITTACAECAAVEENFERVDASTGDVCEVDPDTVAVRHEPLHLSLSRCFQAKGSYFDTLPLLRCSPASGAVPERFIFSHGSYVRLVAAVLLSRFNAVYRLREVLLEGTGNAFPLFPVADMGRCHAVKELDALLQWAVRSALEERMQLDRHQSAPAPAGPGSLPPGQQQPADTLESYYVKLYDYNNFGCLPHRLWEGHLLGTVQDHVKRCMEDCLQNPHVAVRLQRLEQRDPAPHSSLRRRLLSSRRRLFLGVLPSRDTGEDYRLGCDATRELRPADQRLLDDTISLAYSFFHTAQQYNVGGAEGSMLHSVLCGKMPELAIYDCLLVIEKLRLALLHSHLHRDASAGPRAASPEPQKKGKAKGKDKSQCPAAPLDDTVLWSSPLLQAQFRPASSATSGSGASGPTLFTAAVVLDAFFPAKDAVEKELLCRALAEDVMALGLLSRTVGPDEARRGVKLQNDHLFINESARAMLAVVLEREAVRRHEEAAEGTPPPPALVFDETVIALLRTPVPVDSLFRYQQCFLDYAGQVWRKSNLVEVVRALYSAEVFDYCAEMMAAIIQAESTEYMYIAPQQLAVDVFPKCPPAHQRSIRQLRPQPFKFATPTTGVASVRAVLDSISRCDPRRPQADTEEYLHHLLMLYFRDHPFPTSQLQQPLGAEAGPLTPVESADIATLMNWFGAPPPQALCDHIFVDVYALAALCPYVLGRRLLLYPGDEGGPQQPMSVTAAEMNRGVAPSQIPSKSSKTPSTSHSKLNGTRRSSKAKSVHPSVAPHTDQLSPPPPNGTRRPTVSEKK